MKQKEFIEELKFELERNATKFGIGHNIEHALRVLENGLKIAKKIKGIDKEILIAALMLHDADKIDGVGNEGIKRVEEIAKTKNWPKEYAAEWYLGRIIDVAKNEPLYFKNSKEIAKPKLKISLNWCKRILKERFEKIIAKEGFSGIDEISEFF